MEFTPAPYSPPPSPTADDIQNFEPDPPGLPLPSPGPPEDIPEQPHTPLQPLDRAETPPNPPPTQNCARRIAYDRRLPPAIDIDELSRVTVIPKLRHNMEYVSLLRNASLEDPIAKMTPAQLNRLRNPPETQIPINNPGIRHSITTYLALENSSQKAYNDVIKSTQANFSGAPGVDDCLLFNAVEDFISGYTGIDPIEHDMCPNSCIAFTGPFADLEMCPTCNTSRWHQGKLAASHGRTKVPAKTFTTLPLGPQLQALYRDPESALDMSHLSQQTQAHLDEYEETQRIGIIDDVAAGWDYLGASLAGDIKEDDIVVMTSLDGAQLYEDKDSDCWIYVWVILNISPDKRYRKTHVLPGGFIPGPNKPKNIDSFMAVGLHHLSALQKEGLKIWNSSLNRALRSRIYLLFTTADGPGLVHWDGLVGHCGKNGCRLYCGVRGRHKNSSSHYYPVLLCPHNAHRDSSHADISSFRIPPAGSQEYSDNLFYLMSAPNPTQFDSRRTETGICKAPLILGLDPKCSLGIPLAMTTDIMHLAGNISTLLIELWRGTMKCERTDNIESWDWAVLRDENVWKAHGRAVEEAGYLLPTCFDTRPRNIAEKIHSDYKTWEFLIHTFGLAPGLLHDILPMVYWKNFCKLVRGFQLISQHNITHDEALEATVLLASWANEFEEIYYQRRNDRIHFIRPCVHQVLHLGPETFQKGPPICTAQWTMERTIGNIKRQIRQHSTYLANFSREGLRLARVNALLAALPELNTFSNVNSTLPARSLDLGNGYALLRKRDKQPVIPPGDTYAPIWEFLDRPDVMPKIFRYARLLLPNGQVGRCAWRENVRKSTDNPASNNLRVSRMIKVSL